MSKPGAASGLYKLALVGLAALAVMGLGMLLF